MKRTLATLSLILIFILSSFSNIPEKDKDNWIKLDWIVRGTVPFRKNTSQPNITLKYWEDRILVSLTGNYTKQDSLELDKIIKAFNNAIPNREIGWGGRKSSNLYICFTDLNAGRYFNRNYLVSYNNFKQVLYNQESIFLNHKFSLISVSEASLFVHNEQNPEKRANILWHSFSKTLVEVGINTGFNIDKLSVLGGKQTCLTDFDKFFFKTIYSIDFRKDYLSFIKSEYNIWEEFKFLTKEDTKANITFTLFLLLNLLIVYFIYKYIWLKFLDHKIKGKFLRFHIIGLVFFLPQILLSPVILLPDILELQHYPSNPVFIIISGGVIAVISFIAHILIFQILYFIEHILFAKVQTFKNRQLVRVFSMSLFMVFLSILNLSIDNPYIPERINAFLVIITSASIILIRLFYFYDQHQKAQIHQSHQLKINKLEQLQTKFQLEAIQARTNPHFLYNSLNTIASLARQDADKTEDFALKLSNLLRLRLQENPPSEISVAEEMETIELYLEIEKERFHDRLEYSIDIPKNAADILIPSDILLYLIENSVKHGISKQTRKGTIKIQVTENMHHTNLIVYDNGPNFPDTPIYGTGLKSIMEKLDILYPENYEFAIFNYPEKRVEITLNKQK